MDYSGWVRRDELGWGGPCRGSAIGTTDAGWYSGHVRVYQWSKPGPARGTQLGADIDGEAARHKVGQ